MNAQRFDYSKIEKIAGENAGLVKVQDQAIKASHKARELIQLALVATLIHLGKHHDVRMASRLVDGLNGTVRGTALVRYLLRFGHLEIGKVKITDADGKEKSVDGFISIVGNGEQHAAAIRKTLDEAKATAWYELTPPASPYSFALENALLAVETRAKAAAKRIAEGKAKPEDVDFHISDEAKQHVMRLLNFEQIVDEEIAKAKAADKAEPEAEPAGAAAVKASGKRREAVH